MNKKKTLVLTENFPPLSGGSGRWFWELYSRLPRDEYIVVADLSCESLAFDKTHDVNVIRIPLKSKEWGFKSLIGLKFYWQCFKSIKKIIKNHNITHIHTGRVIHEGVIAWLLAFFYNIEYTCYVHGEDVETAATSREHNLMVKSVCNKANTIICNSFNSAEIVKRLGYAQSNKIKVLHPGVDAHKFIPVAKNPEFLGSMNWTNKKIIITVGRLQKRKGQDKMIEAMPEILKKHPNTVYAIIGRGECKALLESKIKQYNLDKHVQLLDEISDEQMIQCYQQCDLFILPNRTIDNDIEGFGMVLVEAQSCGKPVIAGDSGGTKETMKVGESGYIIDCTLPSVISEKINKLLSDSMHLDMLGDNGRKYVLEQLDWDVHVKKAKKIFEKGI